jgi:dihydroxyacetone kinase-like protein
MKKLINDPKSVVEESVQGFGQAHADLVNVSADPTFITRKDAPVSGKVGLVSGGGSGHEPLHAGFVGRGMLDAAVPGAVFTSPTPDQILPATLAVNSGAGVVHIVKNYTGDVLNFETAAELSEAEGVNVRTVLVNDDVAVEDSLYTAGRRGVGGTVLVEKIAGAAAERGRRPRRGGRHRRTGQQQRPHHGRGFVGLHGSPRGFAKLRPRRGRDRNRHRDPW